MPLAVSLSKFAKVIGFDVNKKRIQNLRKHIDDTNEFKSNYLKKVKDLNYSFKTTEIKDSDIFFITVPTPINKKKKPDLKNLIDATKIVSRNLKKGSIIVYESTVFPGCTEEICLPLIEKISNLKYNKDFYLAYSPERINPGKSKFKLKNTVKIVGSSNKKILRYLKKIYQNICLKVHPVIDIKTAEAAKIIENTQRDINIALINEFSIIFKKMNLDINKILEAANTKWNFIKFEPGLVGGHCIGVDPYYLTYKLEKMNYKPKMILAGRKINDNMSKYVAKKILNDLKLTKPKKKKILILGATFKENCSDLRNSKIFDTIKFLEKKGIKVYLFDPLVPIEELKSFKGNIVKKLDRKNFYDAAVISVKHEEFIKLGIKKIRQNIKNKGLIFDLKSTFPNNQTDWHL